MANDEIAKLNADIIDRLKASDDFIKSGLTAKPASDAKPAPAKRATSSRSRKR